MIDIHVNEDFSGAAFFTWFDDDQWVFAVAMIENG